MSKKMLKYTAGATALACFTSYGFAAAALPNGVTACQSNMLHNQIVLSCIHDTELKNAAQLILQGDPARAQFPLERIAASEPDNYNAQWMLALAYIHAKYYRLAFNQLQLLLAHPLPPFYQQVFQNLFDRLAAHIYRTHKMVWGSVGVYGGYNSNANNASNVGTFFGTFDPAPQPIDPLSQAIKSGFTNIAASLGGQTPFTSRGKLEGTFYTNYMINTNPVASRFDIYQYQFNGAYRLTDHQWVFGIPVSLAFVQLGGQPFAQINTGGVEFGRLINKGNALVAFFTGGVASYFKTSKDFSGDLYTGGITWTHSIIPSHIIWRTTPFFQLNAATHTSAPYNSYNSEGVNNEVSWKVRYNFIPYLTAGFQHYAYFRINPFLLGKNRTDNIVTAGTGFTYNINSTMQFTSSYNYTKDLSSNTVYAFTGNIIQAGFTWVYNSKPIPDKRDDNDMWLTA